MKGHTHHSLNPRRGITLLEVLISMFVALIGLAGLASLFWIGGIEMSEGAKAERTLAVARAAQRTFKALGVLRPIQTYTYVTTGGAGTPPTQTVPVQMWIMEDNQNIPGNVVDFAIDHSDVSPSPSSPANYYSPPVMPFSQTSLPMVLLPPAPAIMPNALLCEYSQGFCIDPIGMTKNPGVASAFPAFDPNGAPIDYTYPLNPFLWTVSGTNAPNAQYTYPTGSSQAPSQYAVNASAPGSPPKGSFPCLTRVNLRASPTASDWNSSNGAALTIPQAELFFRSSDDLMLYAPIGDYPPVPTFSPLAGPPSRRQFQGDYSWLATVVPSFRTFQTYYNAAATAPTPPTTITPEGDPNKVIVSIVVFYKRNAYLVNPSGGVAPSERMVQVNMSPYQPGGATGSMPTGTAGGDVQLILGANAAANLDTATQQAYLNVKAGQWIMLSQAPQGMNAYTSPPPGTAPAKIANTCIATPFWYRWYKVVGTGPVQNNGGVFYRNVTLSGPDWNPNPTNAASAGTNPTVTFASIFDGVVGVYEKEMELEQVGSPWAPY